MRKQTVGNRVDFLYFILLKDHFEENEVRFIFKKCNRNKSFISFILFFYALLALKMIASRRVENCSLPDTGHGMAVVNLNGFSLAVYCIFVIML